ncbi:hypothetical protein [Neobacillus sp. NPDC093127]|uniref:hypothetical protein n=1 Tax=Neobacillus sp. NPDC093127 TaxID=3364296 RepID=UPI003826BD21
MNQTKYREVWDLEKLFPGGSQSIQFCEHIEQLEVKVDELEEKIEFFHTPLEFNDSFHVANIIDQIVSIQLNLSQITCLLGQNPKDQHAAILRGKINLLIAVPFRLESPSYLFLLIKYTYTFIIK